MRQFPRSWLLVLFASSCSGGVDLTGDAAADGAGDELAEAIDGVDGLDGTEAGDEMSADGSDVAPEDAGGDEGAEASDDGGSGDCAPMDAHAEGDCEMVLPGVAWNGAHCVPLGSGCRCAGADCDAVYDDVASCVAARLSCYGEACGAQEAAGRTCEGGCALAFGPFWDGRECFTSPGCECVGDDCAGAWASLDECVAVHAGCDAALCLAAGGQWFPASAGFCGFSCGVANPMICFTPYESCACPPGETFISGAGCLAGAEACDPALLCGGTGGTWHPASDCFCGFWCGSPGACGACLDSCDCGPHANFDETRGCVPDPACPGTDREASCTSTGGLWHDCSAGDPGCSCGDYVCGVPNRVEPCVMPGCDCGELRNFDAERGCVWDDACVLRGPHEDCSGGADSSTCREGLVCCSTCGAYPCLTCLPPCCPDDPGCMTDGCPMPPP